MKLRRWVCLTCEHEFFVEEKDTNKAKPSLCPFCMLEKIKATSTLIPNAITTEEEPTTVKDESPKPKELIFSYKGIRFDDITRKESPDMNDWSQICESCVQTHHISSDVLDRDSGSGICGVEGCGNEADHYIDFPDGELQEV